MKKIISAKDLQKISYASASEASNKWWETKLDSLNRLLQKNAKLGFRECELIVPTPYQTFISAKLSDSGYKVRDTGQGDSYKSQTELKVIW